MRCPARRLPLITVVLLLPSAALADRLIDGVPIPDDISIAPVSAPTSDSGQGFVGAWVGRWGGSLKHVLIVESVQHDGTARVIYAVGDNPNATIKRNWIRPPATVRDDTLTITGAFTATYKLTTATTATASFQGGRGRAQAEMTKFDLAALTAPGRKVFVDPESTMIQTKLRENGIPIRLEVDIAKPEGNGPFPLVVINHGSGRGNDPALIGQTFAPPELAEYFVRKGFMVAFPQRRGWSKSEGLFDEGFEVDRSQGYACDAKLALPGADRALTDIEAAVEMLRQRPDVAQQPIVMAGTSRGGILSIAYAGMHPQEVAGVINFVGGTIHSIPSPIRGRASQNSRPRVARAHSWSSRCRATMGTWSCSFRSSGRARSTTTLRRSAHLPISRLPTPRRCALPRRCRSGARCNRSPWS
jgi:dienelactone hydrolase